MNNGSDDKIVELNAGQRKSIRNERIEVIRALSNIVNDINNVIKEVDINEISESDKSIINDYMTKAASSVSRANVLYVDRKFRRGQTSGFSLPPAGHSNEQTDNER
jgi:hypothetical protein